MHTADTDFLCAFKQQILLWYLWIYVCNPSQVTNILPRNFDTSIFTCIRAHV